MDDLRGKEIRGYTITERIGEGGMAVVYRALQTSVDREVAIKVILPEHANNPEFTRRFEAEAQMVARLEHPHIVPLYDYWQDEEGAFLVMRWLPGGSLGDSLSDGPWDIESTGQLVSQITEALAVAHENGVIHRDLKPENILLDEKVNAYLTDFGIAKDIGGDSLTEVGKIVGSLDYLAPEQAKGEEVTNKTDIYALGVLLYEILVGSHPFVGCTTAQLLQKHLNEPLPSICDSCPDLPATLDHVLQTATAKEPEARYLNVVDLREAFANAVGREAVTEPEALQLPTFLRVEEAGPEVEPAVFVARERELEWLSNCLETVLSGKGKVVFVTGGAGRGKTALIDAFCRRAQDEYPEVIVVKGNCNAHSGVGDPYLPFRDIMAMLTGDVESRWSAGTITRDQAVRLWNLLPNAVDALLERGTSLAGIFLTGESLYARTSAASPGDPTRLRRLRERIDQQKSGVSDLEQGLIFEQFTSVLQILADRHPLILVLDDMQWSDRASIDLLFHLSRRIQGDPILILAAYRPDEVALGRGEDRHPLEAVVNEIKAKHGDTLLDLTREEAKDAQDFVDQFLNTEPNDLGPHFQEALIQHTAGHPLFTIELLRAMQERGDLIQDETGTWIEGPELEWDQLPIRVEAVIEERISRLEEDLRELLSVASVEGEDFTAQVLARVQEIDERQLLRELSRNLEKRHRIVRDQGDYKIDGHLLSRFRFAHQLYQRYLYNEISEGERRLLHREIGETLEAILSEEADKYAVQLAMHFNRAGVQERALHYLTLAGHQARASYAYQEAIRYYTEALAHLPEDHPNRFNLLISRVIVYDVLALRAEQRIDLDSMFSLADTIDDDLLRCDALIADADYQLRTQHIHALEPAEKGLELAKRLGDKIREAKALQRIGDWANTRDEFDRSRKLMEEAFEIYLETDRKGEAAMCLHLISLNFGRLEMHTAAMDTALSAVELSREAGDKHQEANSLRRLAIAYFNQNKHEEAIKYATKALHIHREIGDRSNEVNALNVLGINYSWQNNQVEVEKNLKQALDLATSIGFGMGIQHAIQNLGDYFYLPLGEYEQYLHFLKSQIEEVKALENEMLIAYIGAYISFRLHGFGLYEAALGVMKDVLKKIEKTGSKFEFAIGQRMISSAYARLGDFEEARKSLQLAYELSEETGLEMQIVYCHWTQAFISFLEGNLGKMRKDVELLLEGIKRMRELNDIEGIGDWLELAGMIYFNLGEVEKALVFTTEAIELIDKVPHYYNPHDAYLFHAKALRSLGRVQEADCYLKRAFDGVMLVARKTKDDELRQGWLESVRFNREIMEACVEHGIS